MHSNFLTPPDHISDENLFTILLIDPSLDEVKSLGELCQVVGTDFNVYLYHADMEDLPWLETAFNLSNTVIINTASSKLSGIKDRLVAHPKAYYYGPKRFFDNDRMVRSPVEFIISYVQQQSNTDL